MPWRTLRRRKIATRCACQSSSRRSFRRKKGTTPAEKRQSGEGQRKDILQREISKQGESRDTKSSSPVAAVATSTAALIFVVGLFLLVMWFMKRGASRGSRTLPTEAFEILGRSSISQSQAVQLVRIGNKLLLLASSADSISTLTEIDDTEEVTRLSGLCLQNHGTSATQEFHEALEELAARPTETESSFAAPAASSLLEQSSDEIDRVAFSDASLVLPTK